MKFQQFYNKVDEAIQDKDELEKEGSSFQQIFGMITTQQYSDDRDDKEIDLEEELVEIKTTAEELQKERKMTDKICYKNLLNFYHQRYSSNVIT